MLRGYLVEGTPFGRYRLVELLGRGGMGSVFRARHCFIKNTVAIKMIHPDRIGHVVIKVRDIERSRKFYRDVMGLQLMMELPRPKMAFFASNGRDHHEIACMEVGKDPGAVGA